MTTPNITSDAVMFILFLVIVTGVALPFSSYVVRVFSGNLSRGIPGHLEKTIYKLIETDPDREEGWRGYSRDMLIFNGIGFVTLFLLLLLQGFLPLTRKISGLLISTLQSTLLPVLSPTQIGRSTVVKLQQATLPRWPVLQYRISFPQLQASA